MEATELEETQQDQICFCCFSMLGADLHQHRCPSLACAGGRFLANATSYSKAKLVYKTVSFPVHSNKIWHLM